MRDHIGQKVSLAVQIVRIVDTNYPTWVEIDISDVYDKHWRFTDKLPMFAGNEITHVPAAGWLRCSIEEQVIHDDFGPIFKVNTEYPDHIYDDSGSPAAFWMRAGRIDFGDDS